jgi:hypothetical protein
MNTTDLSVYQGDTPAWTVTVTDDDGTPSDITGYTAKAQIRRAPADADEVVVAEMSATVDSPFIHLSLTAAQTTPMTGRYVWDLELTGPAAEVVTIMHGKVTVKAEVTRSVA